MYVNGNADFKRDITPKGEKKTKYREMNVSFHYELKHNGSEWTVRNKKYFDVKE